MPGTVQGIWDNHGWPKGETTTDIELSSTLILLSGTLIYAPDVFTMQALGYEFDNDQFHAYVHGRLPYEALKPDLVLRNLLLSMPQRKIVCQQTNIVKIYFTWYQIMLV